MKNKGKVKVNQRRFLKLYGIIYGCLVLCISTLFMIGSPGGLAFASQSEKPIKVGVLMVKTGLFSTWGDHTYGGVVYAAHEINKAGGILGRKVELIRKDTELSTDIAVMRARRLITEDKVDFLICGDSSSTSIALASVGEKARKMFFNIDGSTEQLRGTKDTVQKRTGISKGGTNRSQYMINCGISAAQRAMAIAQYIVKTNKPWKKFYNFCPDYPFGHDTWTSFIHEMKRLRPETEVVGSDFPSFGTTDYSGYITKIMEAKPDAIFSSNWSSDEITFFNQAEGYKLFERVPAYLCSSGIPETTSAAMGDKFIPNCWASSIYDPMYPPTEENRRFRENYFKVIGEYPYGCSFQGYMTLIMAKKAIEAAGSLDTEAVIKVINGMTFDSPQCKYTLRADRYLVPVWIVVGKMAPGPLPFYTITDPVMVTGKEVTPAAP